MFLRRTGAAKFSPVYPSIPGTSVCEITNSLVVFADPARSEARYGPRGKTLYCLQDTAAAVQNMLLAAVAFDLGAC
ncbi:MAG TPA: hypothetical protein GX509_03425 [Firmicutes bacterium]|nr:hypothetical protein [Bacillota bacterium]HHY97773.1 hypothetical protein [Bacillota bacterium]